MRIDQALGILAARLRENPDWFTSHSLREWDEVLLRVFRVLYENEPAKEPAFLVSPVVAKRFEKAAVNALRTPDVGLCGIEWIIGALVFLKHNRIVSDGIFKED